jgi:ABC-2 type transport system ATP-binding protein
VTDAVRVDGVSKRFRLYHDRNQSLKATLLRGGRARYEDFWALRDIDFAIPEGTSFGLVGENGSGKSTLLKCVARILQPEQGAITVTGRMSALLELGAGFHPELSGRDNVFLNGSILGMRRADIERRFDDIVEFSGLERFIDTPVKNYSSGMYVRLGFAVAINTDPDVLLVDEILAVGDEQFQRRCNERFADLRAAGKTIVVVSHSLNAVRTICDSVAWLDHGELREVGPAGKVIDRYLDEVHVDRTDLGDAGSRWGSGEAQLTALELLGADGAPATQVHTGDAVRFRLHYEAHERIERPVFGLALHTVSGVHVTGPNTREAGVEPEAIDGTGWVDLVVDPLLLLPGTYDLSAAITDRAGLHTFDYRHQAVRFDVEPGVPHETFGGVVSLNGRWQVTPS